MTTFMRNGYSEGDIILVEGSLDVARGVVEATSREVLGAVHADNTTEQLRLTSIFWRWVEYRDLLETTLKQIDAGVTNLNLQAVLAKSPARHVIA